MSGHWGSSPASDQPVWICDNKTAPVDYDTQYPHILGTFGVWVEEIRDFDMATVRLPDGYITVMPTEEAKAMG